MRYLMIPAGLIAAAALILWGVDFYHYLVERYCRYHIGRWPDAERWRNAAIRCAVRWAKKAPTVKITDNNRYLLLDMLQGKHRSHTIQSWQTGGILLGLQHVGGKESELAVQNAAAALLDGNGMFRRLPTNVDCGLLSYALLKSGDAERVRPAMDYAAELIRKHVAADGMISYVNDRSADERYVDTLGLACPFLAAYAAAYGKPEYAGLAAAQLKKFTQYGLEEHSLLPNHAFSTERKLPLGVYGWGRGTGWYVLGLIDTYLELPAGADSEWLAGQILRVADRYLPFQHEDGGFGPILQMKQGYDSSATAVLAYFYRKCAEEFDRADYHAVADRCLEKLRTVTRITGAIDGCQGDTKGIGVFAQTYDVMPFAQGMALRALKGTKD